MEQTLADVPDGNAWLSPSEADELSAKRFAKRRRDWLLGRWTAKNAAALCLGIAKDLQALGEIEIRSKPSGAPEVFLRNEPAPVTISLSHRAGMGACCIAPSHVLLGCDLETIEPHGDAFAADYFTVEEQMFVAKTEPTNRLSLLALFWSGKESALKALCKGLQLDTRSVLVSLRGMPEYQDEIARKPTRPTVLSVQYSSEFTGWNPLQVRAVIGQTFHGWWSQTGHLVRTVVSDPPPDPPILLAQQGCLVC
ncbi:MAG TPA: 4'-phosphopantetheinyl transferase superfamily protein [Candidatus Acidoferrum sp.]